MKRIKYLSSPSIYLLALTIVRQEQFSEVLEAAVHAVERSAVVVEADAGVFGVPRDVDDLKDSRSQWKVTLFIENS